MSQHTALENSQRDEQSVKPFATTGKIIWKDITAQTEQYCTVHHAAVIFTLQLKCDQI